ncbi:hypothetical protein SAMN02745181_1941 [Rubritalea squalenifaciens DSM 18772]|uniref:Uncharacterized protein n=2 Tax=Rubritalea squalenifaciens TaxID=407226 RepID=A0A1M6IX92_9BACT|nr:hypothetical protein SAMN02745181_1941 [Rubritalea squalenifaciens DSM 18772]
MSEIETKEIVCKASSWIKIRAILILAMLAVFAVLFYQDGTTGYKEKNLHFFMNRLFTEQAPQMASEGEYTAESWAEFAKGEEVPFEQGESGVVAKSAKGELCPVPDTALGMEWPEELIQGYEKLKDGGASSGPKELWRDYTKRMEWDAEPKEEPYDLDTVNEQFYFSYGSVALFVVVLFFFLRTLSRTMRVTDEAYFAPGGKEIPFTAMKRIDKRKWDTKGVAVIYYDDAGGSKKTKVDGMIYGQFKKEDGEPAEKLFSKILENFKGEVVEYESDDPVSEEAEASV